MSTVGRRWGSSIVLGALLLLGAAACGSDSGGDAASVNACDLLTTEEADELLGVPTNGPSEDTDRSHGTYCEWVSKDSDDGGDASGAGSDSEIEAYFLNVEHERGEGAVQSFEAGRSDADDDGGEVEAVADLGDDAYFDDIGGLNVRRGDTVISTYTDGNEEHQLTEGERRDIERRAAKLVVGRLSDSTGGTDIEAALECGRTGRCVGTRYRACDVLEDAEIEQITGFEVTSVDGQIVRTESENGGVCRFVLDNPNLPADSSRDIRRVGVYVEPDADAAAEQYEETRTRAKDLGSFMEVTGFGPDAFYSPLYQGVTVLRDGKLLELSYEAELPDFTDDTSAPIVQANLDLAAIALDRLR